MHKKKLQLPKGLDIDIYKSVEFLNDFYDNFLTDKINNDMESGNLDTVKFLFKKIRNNKINNYIQYLKTDNHKIFIDDITLIFKTINFIEQHSIDTTAEYIEIGNYENYNIKIKYNILMSNEFMIKGKRDNFNIYQKIIKFTKICIDKFLHFLKNVEVNFITDISHFNYSDYNFNILYLLSEDINKNLEILKKSNVICFILLDEKLVNKDISINIQRDYFYKKKLCFNLQFFKRYVDKIKQIINEIIKKKDENLNIKFVFINEDVEESEEVYLDILIKYNMSSILKYIDLFRIIDNKQYSSIDIQNESYDSISYKLESIYNNYDSLSYIEKNKLILSTKDSIRDILTDLWTLVDNNYIVVDNKNKLTDNYTYIILYPDFRLNFKGYLSENDNFINISFNLVLHDSNVYDSTYYNHKFFNIFNNNTNKPKILNISPKLREQINKIIVKPQDQSIINSKIDVEIKKWINEKKSKISVLDSLNKNKLIVYNTELLDKFKEEINHLGLSYDEELKKAVILDSWTYDRFVSERDSFIVIVKKKIEQEFKLKIIKDGKYNEYLEYTKRVENEKKKGKKTEKEVKIKKVVDKKVLSENVKKNKNKKNVREIDELIKLYEEKIKEVPQIQSFDLQKWRDHVNSCLNYIKIKNHGKYYFVKNDKNMMPIFFTNNMLTESINDILDGTPDKVVNVVKLYKYIDSYVNLQFLKIKKNNEHNMLFNDKIIREYSNIEGEIKVFEEELYNKFMNISLQNKDIILLDNNILNKLRVGGLKSNEDNVRTINDLDKNIIKFIFDNYLKYNNECYLSIVPTVQNSRIIKYTGEYFINLLPKKNNKYDNIEIRCLDRIDNTLYSKLSKLNEDQIIKDKDLISIKDYYKTRYNYKKYNEIFDKIYLSLKDEIRSLFDLDKVDDEKERIRTTPGSNETKPKNKPDTVVTDDKEEYDEDEEYYDEDEEYEEGEEGDEEYYEDEEYEEEPEDVKETKKGGLDINLSNFSVKEYIKHILYTFYYIESIMKKYDDHKLLIKHDHIQLFDSKFTYIKFYDRNEQIELLKNINKITPEKYRIDTDILLYNISKIINYCWTSITNKYPDRIDYLDTEINDDLVPLDNCLYIALEKEESYYDEDYCTFCINFLVNEKNEYYLIDSNFEEEDEVEIDDENMTYMSRIIEKPIHPSNISGWDFEAYDKYVESIFKELFIFLNNNTYLVVKNSGIIEDNYIPIFVDDKLVNEWYNSNKLGKTEISSNILAYVNDLINYNWCKLFCKLHDVLKVDDLFKKSVLFSINKDIKPKYKICLSDELETISNYNIQLMKNNKSIKKLPFNLLTVESDINNVFLTQEKKILLNLLPLKTNKYNKTNDKYISKIDTINKQLYKPLSNINWINYEKHIKNIFYYMKDILSRSNSSIFEFNTIQSNEIVRPILYNIKDLYKRINIIDNDKSLSDKKSIVSYCVNFIDREFEKFKNNYSESITLLEPLENMEHNIDDEMNILQYEFEERESDENIIVVAHSSIYETMERIDINAFIVNMLPSFNDIYPTIKQTTKTNVKNRVFKNIIKKYSYMIKVLLNPNSDNENDQENAIQYYLKEVIEQFFNFTDYLLSSTDKTIVLETDYNIEDLIKYVKSLENYEKYIIDVSLDVEELYEEYDGYETDSRAFFVDINILDDILKYIIKIENDLLRKKTSILLYSILVKLWNWLVTYNDKEIILIDDIDEFENENNDVLIYLSQNIKNTYVIDSSYLLYDIYPQKHYLKNTIVVENKEEINDNTWKMIYKHDEVIKKINISFDNLDKLLQDNPLLSIVFSVNNKLINYPKIVESINELSNINISTNIKDIKNIDEMYLSTVTNILKGGRINNNKYKNNNLIYGRGRGYNISNFRGKSNRGNNRGNNRGRNNNRDNYSSLLPEESSEIIDPNEVIFNSIIQDNFTNGDTTIDYSDTGSTLDNRFKGIYKGFFPNKFDKIMIEDKFIMEKNENEIKEENIKRIAKLTDRFVEKGFKLISFIDYFNIKKVYENIRICRSFYYTDSNFMSDYELKFNENKELIGYTDKFTELFKTLNQSSVDVYLYKFIKDILYQFTISEEIDKDIIINLQLMMNFIYKYNEYDEKIKEEIKNKRVNYMGKGQYIKVDESYLFVGMNKNYAYELKDEAKEFWDKVKELNKKSIDIFKVLYKQLLTNVVHKLNFDKVTKEFKCIINDEEVKINVKDFLIYIYRDGIDKFNRSKLTFPYIEDIPDIITEAYKQDEIKSIVNSIQKLPNLKFFLEYKINQTIMNEKSRELFLSIDDRYIYDNKLDIFLYSYDLKFKTFESNIVILIRILLFNDVEIKTENEELLYYFETLQPYLYETIEKVIYTYIDIMNESNYSVDTLDKYTFDSIEIYKNIIIQNAIFKHKSIVLPIINKIDNYNLLNKVNNNKYEEEIVNKFIKLKNINLPKPIFNKVNDKFVTNRENITENILYSLPDFLILLMNKYISIQPIKLYTINDVRKMACNFLGTSIYDEVNKINITINNLTIEDLTIMIDSYYEENKTNTQHEAYKKSDLKHTYNRLLHERYENISKILINNIIVTKFNYLLSKYDKRITIGNIPNEYINTNYLFVIIPSTTKVIDFHNKMFSYAFDVTYHITREMEIGGNIELKTLTRKTKLIYETKNGLIVYPEYNSLHNTINIVKNNKSMIDITNEMYFKLSEDDLMIIHQYFDFRQLLFYNSEIVTRKSLNNISNKDLDIEKCIRDLYFKTYFIYKLSITDISDSHNIFLNLLSSTNLGVKNKILPFNTPELIQFYIMNFNLVTNLFYKMYRYSLDYLMINKDSDNLLNILNAYIPNFDDYIIESELIRDKTEDIIINKLDILLISTKEFLLFIEKNVNMFIEKLLKINIVIPTILNLLTNYIKIFLINKLLPTPENSLESINVYKLYNDIELSSKTRLHLYDNITNLFDKYISLVNQLNDTQIQNIIKIYFNEIYNNIDQSVIGLHKIIFMKIFDIKTSTNNITNRLTSKINTCYGFNIIWLTNLSWVKIDDDYVFNIELTNKLFENYKKLIETISVNSIKNKYIDELKFEYMLYSSLMYINTFSIKNYSIINVVNIIFKNKDLKSIINESINVFLRSVEIDNELITEYRNKLLNQLKFDISVSSELLKTNITKSLDVIFTKICEWIMYNNKLIDRESLMIDSYDEDITEDKKETEITIYNSKDIVFNKNQKISILQEHSDKLLNDVNKDNKIKIHNIIRTKFTLNSSNYNDELYILYNNKENNKHYMAGYGYFINKIKTNLDFTNNILSFSFNRIGKIGFIHDGKKIAYDGTRICYCILDDNLNEYYYDENGNEKFIDEHTIVDTKVIFNNKEQLNLLTNIYYDDGKYIYYDEINIKTKISYENVLSFIKDNKFNDFIDTCKQLYNKSYEANKYEYEKYIDFLTNVYIYEQEYTYDKNYINKLFNSEFDPKIIYEYENGDDIKHLKMYYVPLVQSGMHKVSNSYTNNRLIVQDIFQSILNIYGIDKLTYYLDCYSKSLFNQMNKKRVLYRETGSNNTYFLHEFNIKIYYDSINNEILYCYDSKNKKYGFVKLIPYYTNIDDIYMKLKVELYIKHYEYRCYFMIDENDYNKGFYYYNNKYDKEIIYCKYTKLTSKIIKEGNLLINSNSNVKNLYSERYIYNKTLITGRGETINNIIKKICYYSCKFNIEKYHPEILEYDIKPFKMQTKSLNIIYNKLYKSYIYNNLDDKLKYEYFDEYKIYDFLSGNDVILGNNIIGLRYNNTLLYKGSFEITINSLKIVSKNTSLKHGKFLSEYNCYDINTKKFMYKLLSYIYDEYHYIDCEDCSYDLINTFRKGVKLVKIIPIYFNGNVIFEDKKKINVNKQIENNRVVSITYNNNIIYKKENTGNILSDILLDNGYIFIDYKITFTSSIIYKDYVPNCADIFNFICNLSEDKKETNIISVIRINDNILNKINTNVVDLQSTISSFISKYYNGVDYIKSFNLLNNLNITILPTLTQRLIESFVSINIQELFGLELTYNYYINKNLNLLNSITIVEDKNVLKDLVGKDFYKGNLNDFIIDKDTYFVSLSIPVNIVTNDLISFFNSSDSLSIKINNGIKDTITNYGNDLNELNKQIFDKINNKILITTGKTVAELEKQNNVKLYTDTKFVYRFFNETDTDKVDKIFGDEIKIGDIC